MLENKILGWKKNIAITSTLVIYLIMIELFTLTLKENVTCKLLVKAKVNCYFLINNFIS